MGKNKNLISLSAYRKKKSPSKNLKKAVSDESLHFEEEKQQRDEDFPKASSEERQAQIHYMSNYRKAEDKKPEHIPKEEVSYKKFSDHVIILKNFRNPNRGSEHIHKGAMNHKKFSDNVIKLEDYRSKKRQKLSNLRQASSYGAVVALALLLTFVFFPKEDGNRMIAKSPEIGEQKRDIAQTPDKMENLNSVDWFEEIRDKDFTQKEFVIGERPASSEYKGF